MFSAPVTVNRAILVGLLIVNGPVLVFICGPTGLFAFLVENGIVSRDYNWVGLVTFVGGFVVAWCWWSLSVPRWRVWAYKRVSDIRLLKERAVAVGLTWPDGHPFGRTELKSAALRSRERDLDPDSQGPK